MQIAKLLKLSVLLVCSNGYLAAADRRYELLAKDPSELTRAEELALQTRFAETLRQESLKKAEAAHHKQSPVLSSAVDWKAVGLLANQGPVGRGYALRAAEVKVDWVGIALAGKHLADL